MTKGLTLESVEQEIIKIKGKTTQYNDQANALLIKSQTGLDSAVSFIKDLKMLKKEIQSTFKPIIDKAKEAKAAADETRKEAVAQEDKHLRPVQTAIDIINGKINTWDEEQRRIAEEEVLKEQERLRKEQEKKVNVALKKIARYKEKIKDRQELKAELERQLEDPEITEEEAAIIRNELEAIESGIDKSMEAAEVAASLVTEDMPDPSELAMASGPTKAEGMQRRTTYKAFIRYHKVLLKAVVDGTAPISIVEFKLKKIQSLRNQGIELPGVQYVKDSKLV